jgi:putative membrane protein
MMLRKYSLILVMLVSLVLMASSCEKSGVQAAREDSTSVPIQKILSIDEEQFLLNAEKSEVRQQALASVALEKSTNSDIREFARQLKEDQSSALTELRALMTAKKVVQAPGLVDEIQMEATHRLQQQTGRAFDDEFVSLITAEQQDTLRHFNLAAETATDQDVRNYAAHVLPSLRESFQKATGLATRLEEHKLGQ